MSGFEGRQLLIKKNSTVIAGVRAKTITWGGESIDLTSGEDDGVRLLAAASGQEQLDISGDGITKGDVLRDIALDPSTSKMLTDITIEWPVHEGGSTGASISGNFKLTSYEETGPYNDAATFSFSLESSGEWTYTTEAA